MISIAITGGIGSGKSYVSNWLMEQNIPIYNADNEAKRLMLSDVEIRKGLIGLLGEEVYINGYLNKDLLVSFLFANPSNAAQINAIVHPRVKVDFLRWLKLQAAHEIVGLECAILYEAGFEDTVDKVVMVYAPEELRIKRAMKRDNASEEQIKARIAAQMSDEEKCRKADYIIQNDEKSALFPQLMSLITQIKAGKQ